MPKRNWVDGAPGNTPLNAARLNGLESDVESTLFRLAADPSLIWSGSIARDANGAATSASVTWPDGVGGTYSGTASTAFPGAVDSYTITRTGTPFVTFTQAAVTRDTAGNVTNRPQITAT